MLDDLLELGLDLAGEGMGALLGGSKGEKRGRSAHWTSKAKAGQGRPEPQRGLAGKIAAQRKKYGEDPWEWKEKRPPWEG